MKRVLILFVSLLLAFSLSAQQADSDRLAVLGLKLNEYYEALKHESLDVQIQECDFLIESSTDSVVRQFVALDIYRHYVTSPVMGAENVAVHLFDKWFRTGEVKMKSNEDFMAAQVFAEFNRRSLIGMKAPELTMETIDGTVENIYGKDDPSGVFRVLYFYDTDCLQCMVETLLLKNLFSVKDYPVEVYAIYVGDDRQAWVRYVAEKLKIADAIHMWDPELESDFQRKYGVIKTPRLFLIGPDEVILGRGLDVKALESLLDGLFAEKTLNYGSRESEELFNGIFAASDGRPSVREVMGISDYIHDRTLGNADTLMFRQMSGDYLYYLASRTGEGFREGLKYHIDRNILGQDKVWTSADDSLKVVGFAQMMQDLLSRAVPGSRVPEITVPGELYTRRGVRSRNVKLNRIGGRNNIILFYTVGCEVCAAEKEAALNLLKEDRKIRVLMVNVDSLMDNDASLASLLMDSFDLSSLPFIMITDSKGVVQRRYVSLQF